MAMKVYGCPCESGNSGLRKLVARALSDMEVSVYRPYGDKWDGCEEGPDVFEITDKEGRDVAIEGRDISELMADCRDIIESIGWDIAEGDKHVSGDNHAERCIGRAIIACRCYRRLEDTIGLMTDEYVSDDKDPPYVGERQRQFS